MTKKTLSEIAANPNCINTDMTDYDPNSMPVAIARQFIQQFLNPVTKTEVLPIRETLGRILAINILSPSNVPNYDNSAMDGYAFNSDDFVLNQPIQLKIIGTSFAGKAFNDNLKHGECVRIMTGGAIPAGADSVIMQERVTVDGDNVNFALAPKRGMNVRYAGEDLKQGQVVLTVGHMIRAADLGLIASLGIGEITVYQKLKVAFFSTGDELVSVGNPLKTGQVYDSNRYSLFGMLSRMNVEIIDLGAIPDDPELLESTLINAAEQADVVITSGGVSVGEADYMKQLLTKHGEVVFWKIAMKPGRPLAFGNIKTKKLNDFDIENEKLNGFSQAHFFGLPGNPVAVMVTFYQFVREALLLLMGQPKPAPLLKFHVICTEPIKKLAGRTEFQRGILFADEDGSWKVKPTGAQGSAILSSMSLANCFIVLDDEIGNLEAGALVQVQVMDGIV